MSPSTTIVTTLLALSFLHACADSELGQAPVPPDYAQSIREWKEYRIGRLTEPTGWLRTGDLIWLEERSEEHTSELQSRGHLVSLLLLVKKTLCMNVTSHDR